MMYTIRCEGHSKNDVFNERGVGPWGVLQKQMLHRLFPPDHSQMQIMGGIQKCRILCGRYLWMATKCVNKSGVTDRLGDEAEIATLLVLSTIELRGLTPI